MHTPGHILDPAKGDVNCMYYAAKFATPVMAAYAFGPAATTLWLRTHNLFEDKRQVASIPIARNALIKDLLKFARRLGVSYGLVWIAYILLSIPTFDKKLDVDNDGVVSWTEWLGDVTNAVSFGAVVMGKIAKCMKVNQILKKKCAFVQVKCSPKSFCIQIFIF